MTVRATAPVIANDLMAMGVTAGALQVPRTEEHAPVFAPAGLIERGSVAPPMRSARAAARR